MKKISKMKASKLGNSSSSIPAAVSGSTTANGRAKGPTSTSSALDDTNLKVLRDLCHVDSNRYCFECGQRGPTYVDVTIGSFICMQCSGLLRGLTPPHRVKSISMASFTVEEMELLKSHGNEYCRKVWLATYTTKDTQLNSSDPDRVNALKALMSSKYEQKRYYIDPSRLPKAELLDIQGKNLKAVVNGSVQKSPSSTHSNPSPVLNNLRSNFNSLHEQGKPRLTTSITLPDIKPLSSLDPGFSLTSLNADLSTLSISSTSSSSSGGMNSAITSRPHHSNHNNGAHPPPIQFINNLSSTANGHSSSSNPAQSLSPWNSTAGEQSQQQGWKNEDFNQNFADFEDAFSNSQNGNNGMGMNGAVVNEVQQQLPQKYMNGGFQPIPSASISMQNPLRPNGDVQNGFHGVNGTTNANFIHAGNGSEMNSSEDKYAALKDLDSLFKQNPEGVTGTSTLQTSALTSSVSVPANLSSPSINGHDSNGWFSTVSPSSTHNPFSQAVNGNSWTTSWANGSGMNGSGLSSSSTSQNVHNPFFANTSNGGGGNNGWNSNTADKNASFIFPSSSGPQMGTPSQQNQQHGHLGNYRSTELNGFKSGFNPFFAQQQQKIMTNPNNPFL